MTRWRGTIMYLVSLALIATLAIAKYELSHRPPATGDLRPAATVTGVAQD